MSVSVVHYSSKIFFLILNFLSFYLQACNISENTVYKNISNGSFLGEMAKREFSFALYYTELDFVIVFISNSLYLLYQTRIKINIMKVNYWLKVYIGVLNHL